jgi:hypothetical protein
VAFNVGFQDAERVEEWHKAQMKMRKGLFFGTLDNKRCREITGVGKKAILRVGQRLGDTYMSDETCKSKLPFLDQMIVFCAWLRHGDDQQVEQLDLGHLSPLTTEEVDDICYYGWMATGYAEFGLQYGFSPKKLGTEKPLCLRRLYPKATCFVAFLPIDFHDLDPEDGDFFVVVAFALDGRIIFVSSKFVVHGAFEPPNPMENLYFLTALQPGMQVKI